MGNYTGVVDRAGERSTGDIVQDVVRDVQEIVRSEIRLARTELSGKASQASRAGAMFGGAAAAGLLGGMALTATIIAILAEWLPVWGSALIVTIVLAVSGLLMYQAGRRRLARFTPVPRQTVETIKEDVEWAKQRRK